MRALSFALLLFAPAVAFADRPNEDEMFGGQAASQPAAPAPSTPASPTTGGAPPGDAPDRDAQNLSSAPTLDAFLAGRVKENPLTIGGRFYLSASGTGEEHTNFVDSPFHVPLLLDLYADVRPNDRVRAQVVGRLQYDPFLSTLALPGAPRSQNPAIGLDQAWLSFDIAHTVFVTAGRQHVKWGTAHVFTPTDFLASQFRDPLSVIDTRLGVTMLKASLPWESKGWNFYAVAVFEPTQLPATGLGSAGSSGSVPLTAVNTQPQVIGTTIGNVGGAARAEFALSGTQIGIDGLLQKGRHERGGLDITTALGPVDVYAEAALKSGSDLPYFDKLLLTVPGVGSIYQGRPYDKVVGQVAGGISYDQALPNNRSLTLDGEYFFNSVGYSDYHVYPSLIYFGAFQPFYNGMHYGALSAVFIDNETHSTYTLSNIGNFSDLSFITRLDFSILVISHLTVNAWADVHYGQLGGEMRFALNVPANLLGGTNPAINVPAPIVDIGVGLRVSL